MSRASRTRRHGSIALAPVGIATETVFTGRADEIIAAREAVQLAAYQAHPERFVHGIPKHRKQSPYPLSPAA